MENIARSVVDDRQPYFVVNGQVLTFEENEKAIMKEIVQDFTGIPTKMCTCWRCNKSSI